MRRRLQRGTLTTERRLYDDLFDGRRRAINSIPSVILLVALWAVTCSTTWREQETTLDRAQAIQQDFALSFAPTVIPAEKPYAPDDIAEGRAASGHERPLMATPGIKPARGEDARITDSFGPRIHPITGVPGFHDGTDIAVPKGTRFLPIAPGMVVFKGYAGGAGLMIRVRHEDGYESKYLHMQRAYVSVGDAVTKKTELGEAGSTGRSTAPHIHFGAERDFGGRIGKRPVPPSEIVAWALAKYGE